VLIVYVVRSTVLSFANLCVLLFSETETESGAVSLQRLFKSREKEDVCGGTNRNPCPWWRVLCFSHPLSTDNSSNWWVDCLFTYVFYRVVIFSYDIMVSCLLQWPRVLRHERSSLAGIVGSNPTRCIDVCVRLFCASAPLCVGGGLVTVRSPVQGALPTVYRI
jgi:hypothetical protein